ncbi:hypothetical protein TWF102_008343 [Orbilia oligospora]|uniref:BTB domain-containing protein n=1 Tax=Orbilia oligospora TaxID=2813651 RepID=A0A7C8N9E5_ORBOL|nr:hypothetical protein TWF102_008343 [Orbilia oligospora]KAF3093960.1 hypothetical protein TWF103_010644 [Orbilia oligospora]KAF3108223.1 hypothetical protein TWF706_002121 [Orbilia oligospora]KAF3120669.1 hypothetical protein TWF703_002373 [Orbilia oligospora]KAF3147791.1 hypothetical protein TWF594_002369 [Orbilia oligospora]
MPEFLSNCRHRCYNNRIKHSCNTYDGETEDFKSENGKLKVEKDELEDKERWMKAEILELESIRLKTYMDRVAIQRFSGFLDSETVTVLVGRERKKYTAHVNAIRGESAYFWEYLSPQSAKIRGKTVTLDTEVDNSDTFGIFLQYCYLGTYALDNRDDVSTSHPLLSHARVYTLAEKLKCPPLKDLSLQRATDWCYGHGLQKDGGKFSDIYPNVLEAIRVVYTYTVDLNSGIQPLESSTTETGDCKEKEIVLRDGFRLLLARLAAAYLVDLRPIDAFVEELHHSFPDFNTDMLLFMNDGPKTLTEKIMDLSPERELLLGLQAHLKTTDTAQLQRKNFFGFSNLFGSDTYTVFVGENVQRFDVHTSALKCSDYFRKLAVSNMEEAHQKTVYLDSEVDSAEAFDMFVQYCYFEDYFYDESRVDNLVHHARTYLLADRLGCIGLKDLALQKANLLCYTASSSPDIPVPDELLIMIPSAVALIYENTYDIHGGKISRTIEISGTDAVGEPSDTVEENKNESTTTKETIPEKDRERFRLLLARFASVYLSKLREQKAFVATHHAFPDFATDVMLLATGGEKIIPKILEDKV